MFTLYVTVGTYISSVASVDTNGIESLFSKDLLLSVKTVLRENKINKDVIELLKNKPNPSDEAITIFVLDHEDLNYSAAFISIKELCGSEIKKKTNSFKRRYQRSGL